MLLDIVIIVLRETLEASVLIGVLLSASRQAGGKTVLWVFPGLALGSLGALLYSLSLGEISEWFDYAGQEVINASIQYTIYVLLGVIVSLLFVDDVRKKPLLLGLMAITVGMAVIREGSELFVFYTAFLQQTGSVLQATTSGFIGLAIGMSAGAIGYYVLVMQKTSRARFYHALVLTLIATGMAMQATQLLIQVDWISVSEPVWDSNWIISEPSAAGQMLYAVFGYEATPSMTEIILYFVSILMILGLIGLSRYFFSNERSLQ